MTVPIDYPVGATKATLAVTGLGYSEEYADLTGDSFTFTLPSATSPETENVYDLTLTFDNGVERTAKLGLVQGLSPRFGGDDTLPCPVRISRLEQGEGPGGAADSVRHEDVEGQRRRHRHGP